jgi:MoaA/NifB/PqqE/SkfB family radical SAM enzyme
MIYLVYGDSGFAEYLKNEHPNDMTVVGDKATDIVVHRPDIVVFFANAHSETYLERNLLDITMLLNASIDCGAHFHLAYTTGDSDTPQAASQQGAELLARSYGCEYGLDVTVSRSSEYAIVKSALPINKRINSIKTNHHSQKINQFNSSEKILRHIDKLDYFFNGHKTLVVTELDLTNKCNNKCPNCIGTNQNGAEMTKQQIDKVAASLREIAACGVILSGGGEPLVSPYFSYAVDLLRRNGLKLGLNSNGLALNEENASVIADNCEYFRISVDAASPFMYEKTHGMPEKAFEKVRENCRMFADIRNKRSSSTSFGLGFLTGPDTVGEMEKFVIMACEIGADFAQFRPYQDDQTDVSSEIARLQSKYNRKNFSVVGSLQKYKEMANSEERTYSKCMGMWFSTVITADAGVYACLHYRQSKPHFLGSLDNQSLSDIFRSARMREVFESINCAECPVRCRNDAFNRTLDTLALELINIEFL